MFEAAAYKPVPKNILIISHSHGRGSLVKNPPSTDKPDAPMLAMSMLAIRNDRQRAWSNVCPSLRFVGDMYTSSGIFNRNCRGNVWPGHTVADAISNFTTLATAVSTKTPTEVILIHGENDLYDLLISPGGSSSAQAQATLLTRYQTLWGLVAAQWPTARKIQCTMLNPDPGALTYTENVTMSAQMLAGTLATGASEFVDLTGFPRTGCPATDLTHPKTPDNYSTEAGFLGPYTFSVDGIFWVAMQIMRKIYEPYGFTVPTISGETFP